MHELPPALAAKRAAGATVAYLCTGMTCSAPLANLGKWFALSSFASVSCRVALAQLHADAPFEIAVQGIGVQRRRVPIERPRLGGARALRFRAVARKDMRVQRRIHIAEDRVIDACGGRDDSSTSPMSAMSNKNCARASALSAFKCGTTGSGSNRQYPGNTWRSPMITQPEGSLAIAAGKLRGAATIDQRMDGGCRHL